MLYCEKFLKTYSPIHFTIETDVNVIFSHYRLITTKQYFNTILYNLIKSIFMFLQQLFILYELW